MDEIKTPLSFWKYVDDNAHSDVTRLLLRKESLDFDKNLAITQIICRKKLTGKIPDLLKCKEFLFPHTVSAEQCTCQEIAQFHATLFDATDTVLDMTTGLGVDDIYISSRCKHLTGIEIDSFTAAVAQRNMLTLQRENVTIVNDDCAHYISSCNQSFSKIFIDPARRGDNAARLYGLHDCHPDILSLIPEVSQHTSTLIIKASPMLDISQCIEQLPQTTHIYVLSVKGECKELLLVADLNIASAQSTRITAINFNGSNTPKSFEFTWGEECDEPEIVTPGIGDLLFEPNAGIMKTGAFGIFARTYNLCKLHRHSHLFTATSEHASSLSDIPARAFVVDEIIPFKDKDIKRLKSRIPKANIATRNFRLSAEALRKRLGIADGGDTYIFATTLSDDTQALLITHKAEV